MPGLFPAIEFAAKTSPEMEAQASMPGLFHAIEFAVKTSPCMEAQASIDRGCSTR